MTDGTCEWDPVRGQPAAVVVVPVVPVDWDRRERQGCPSPATLCVGANGDWHLCATCAALPCFRRFRRRVPLVAR